MYGSRLYGACVTLPGGQVKSPPERLYGVDMTSTLFTPGLSHPAVTITSARLPGMNMKNENASSDKPQPKTSPEDAWIEQEPYDPYDHEAAADDPT